MSRDSGASRRLRLVHASQSTLGEGPVWDSRQDLLVWVDILGIGDSGGVVRVARFDGEALNVVAEHVVGQHVGVAVPAAAGGWLLAAGRGFAYLSESGDVMALTAPEADNPIPMRMNDGACDPQGRFWVGSLAYDETPGAGSLYRMDGNGQVNTVLRGLTIPNGLGWSPDGETMYVTDSGPGTIMAYQFDGDTGEIGSPRPFLAIPPDEGAPDGLSIDRDGNVWVAIWGGGEIRQYSPDGTQLSSIRVPVTQPSSCVFGGPAGDVLFITSARVGLSEAELARQPEAGGVFAMRPGVSGPATPRFAGRLPVWPARPRRETAT